MTLNRTLASYEGCTAYAVSSGSPAQMAYFVTDAKHDIAALAASNAELLEALRNAKGFLDTPISRRRNEGDSFYSETVASINAAIAKAEGQP